MVAAFLWDKATALRDTVKGALFIFPCRMLCACLNGSILFIIITGRDAEYLSRPPYCFLFWRKKKPEKSCELFSTYIKTIGFRRGSTEFFRLLGQYLHPWRWNRQVAPKRQYKTNSRRVTTQKTEEFKYNIIQIFGAEVIQTLPFLTSSTSPLHRHVKVQNFNLWFTYQHH
jgi:hypothetical protein